jgi:uncharacterized protein
VTLYGQSLFGRTELLERLGNHLSVVRTSGQGRILAVRGRRQVGKSTAVTAFVESADAGYLYATGIKGAPAGAQLAAVAEAARGSRRPVTDAALLFSETPASWRDFFGRLAVAARTGPITVVLDEFPSSIESDASIEGELQVQWDRTLDKLPILLILIGSDVAMMRRISEHDRPLFGRTEQVVVPALNPSEVASALPGRSAVEVFDSYLITGGYPRLVASCARTRSVAAYIQKSFQDEHSDLAVTARLSLDAEFADAEAAHRVLSAIGRSEVASPGFNDVVAAISDPSERDAAKTATTRALGVLTSVKDMVRIDVPAGAPANSKLRRYRITDSYLRFWFRFLERQIDNISRGRPDIAQARFDAGWLSWRGKAIEPVVHDALTRLAASDERLAGIETVGAWWNRDNSVEVDAVAREANRVIALATIKWRARGGVTRSDVTTLATHRAIVPGATDARLLAISAQNTPSGTGADQTLTALDLLTAWA